MFPGLDKGLLKWDILVCFLTTLDKISNVSEFGVKSFLSVHSLGEQSITVGDGAVPGCEATG